MTDVIVHRVNSAAQLRSTPKTIGVEIDVRSNIDGLYLSHDPFATGPRLEDWIKDYSHQTIILNVKEDGLEDACADVMSRSNVSSYFFLDQTLPTVVARGRLGLRNMACRFSEFEPIESVKLLAGFCDWVWVDSFGANNLSSELIQEFLDMGLKVCAVSPELHPGNSLDAAKHFAKKMKGLTVPLDAVCTKFPELWMNQ